MTTDRCEATKSFGYDPTGESAVQCGAPGEFCPICEMVVCTECHAEITGGQLHKEASAPKKPEAVVGPKQRKAG